MRIKLAFTLLLLVATSLTVADKCDFSVSPLSSLWVGMRPAAMDCMEAVPLRAGENVNTIAAIRKVFEGYSFSDLVTATVAPFNLNVRSALFPPCLSLCHCFHPATLLPPS